MTHDPLSSIYALSRDERERLARMPAHINLIDRMVMNELDVRETETLAAMLGLLRESKVA